MRALDYAADFCFGSCRKIDIGQLSKIHSIKYVNDKSAED